MGSPNGWAPLEWMTIWGLDRCGQNDLARDIATTLGEIEFECVSANRQTDGKV